MLNSFYLWMFMFTKKLKKFAEFCWQPTIVTGILIIVVTAVKFLTASTNKKIQNIGWQTFDTLITFKTADTEMCQHGRPLKTE